MFECRPQNHSDEDISCLLPPEDSIESRDNEDIVGTRVVAAEDTPLLRTNSQPISQKGVSESHHITTRWIVPTILAIIVILQCGDQLMEPPLIRVFESIYCYQYWEQQDPSKLLASRENVAPGAVGGVEERFCKVPDVQASVALLQGNLNLFNGLPCES